MLNERTHLGSRTNPVHTRIFLPLCFEQSLIDGVSCTDMSVAFTS